MWIFVCVYVHVCICKFMSVEGYYIRSVAIAKKGLYLLNSSPSDAPLPPPPDRNSSDLTQPHTHTHESNKRTFHELRPSNDGEMKDGDSETAGDMADDTHTSHTSEDTHTHDDRLREGDMLEVPLKGMGRTGVEVYGILSVFREYGMLLESIEACEAEKVKAYSKSANDFNALKRRTLAANRELNRLKVCVCV